VLSLAACGFLSVVRAVQGLSRAGAWAAPLAALPTGNKPHTGEQLLTGGTKEDFVEALRAGAPATPEQQPSDLRHVELSRHPHHPRDWGEGV